MAEHPLSLKNLTRFDFSREKMEVFNTAWAAREQAYKDKYGDKWQEQMDADFHKHNDMLKRRMVNMLIYSYGRFDVFPSDHHSDAELAAFDVRLHEVYGDQYDELIVSRKMRDPCVAELLIQDALRTGDWEALPEELQQAYHERVGKML